MQFVTNKRWPCESMSAQPVTERFEVVDSWTVLTQGKIVDTARNLYDFDIAAEQRCTADDLFDVEHHIRGSFDGQRVAWVS
jgi:hypothetical protein